MRVSDILVNSLPFPPNSTDFWKLWWLNVNHNAIFTLISNGMFRNLGRQKPVPNKQTAKFIHSILNAMKIRKILILNHEIDIHIVFFALVKTSTCSCGFALCHIEISMIFWRMAALRTSYIYIKRNDSQPNELINCQGST